MQQLTSHLTDCSAPRVKDRWWGRARDSSVGFRKGPNSVHRTLRIATYNKQTSVWYRSGQFSEASVCPTASELLRFATLWLNFRSTVLFSVTDTLFIYLQSVGVFFQIAFLSSFRGEKQIMVIMN
jgi:hypothetical protein